jgi:hypothetical protein
MDHAPIILFTYRRPYAIKSALDCLSQCPETSRSRIIVYSDGPKPGHESDVAEARRVLSEQKHVRIDDWVRRDSNLGLRRSVVAGVTETLAAYGKAVVLEEDLLVSVGFLNYMNEALRRYSDDLRVYQVSGHSFPISTSLREQAALLPITTTWGWATWKRAWECYEDIPQELDLLDQPVVARAFDLDGVYGYTSMLRGALAGQNDSWGIRWLWSVFRRGGLALFPFPSLVHNDGFGSSATHTKSAPGSALQSTRWEPTNRVLYWPSSTLANEQVFIAWKRYLGRSRELLPRAINKATRLIRRCF